MVLFPNLNVIPQWNSCPWWHWSQGRPLSPWWTAEEELQKSLYTWLQQPDSKQINQKTNPPCAAVLALSPLLPSFSDKSWNTTNTEDHIGDLYLTSSLFHFLLGLFDLLSSLLLPLLPLFRLFLIQLPPLPLQLLPLLLHLFGLLPSAGFFLPLRNHQSCVYIKGNCTPPFQNHNKPNYFNFKLTCILR